MPIASGYEKWLDFSKGRGIIFHINMFSISKLKVYNPETVRVLHPYLVQIQMGR